MGIIVTLMITLPYMTTYSLKQIYLGVLKNPQYLYNKIDGKMWLYLVGASLLSFILISCAIHQPTSNIILHVCLFHWFIIDYLIFEYVHLFTYDFIAENLGGKLTWGCLVFYPFFYSFSCYYVSNLSTNEQNILSYFRAIISCLIFFSGYVLSRGANMQKYYFKIATNKSKFKTISNPKNNKHLLIQGFWKMARHINYFGEILMATGLAIALDPTHWSSWLYPLYYILLLIPRERDDNERCQRKYKKIWSTYCQRVPYRIVPGIY